MDMIGYGPKGNQILYIYIESSGTLQYEGTWKFCSLIAWWAHVQLNAIIHWVCASSMTSIPVPLRIFFVGSHSSRAWLARARVQTSSGLNRVDTWISKRIEALPLKTTIQTGAGLDQNWTAQQAWQQPSQLPLSCPARFELSWSELISQRWSSQPEISWWHPTVHLSLPNDVSPVAFAAWPHVRRPSQASCLPKAWIL